MSYTHSHPLSMCAEDFDERMMICKTEEPHYDDLESLRLHVKYPSSQFRRPRPCSIFLDQAEDTSICASEERNKEEPKDSKPEEQEEEDKLSVGVASQHNIFDSKRAMMMSSPTVNRFFSTMNLMSTGTSTGNNPEAATTLKLPPAAAPPSCHLSRFPACSSPPIC